MEKLDTVMDEVEQKVESGVAAATAEVKKATGNGSSSSGPMKMPEVFLWSNPINSGIVFASGIVVYLVLEVFEYTVLGLLAQVVAYTLLAGLAYAGFKTAHVKFLSGAPMDPNRASWPLAHFTVDRNTVHNSADAMVDALNASLDQAKEVFYVQNMILTAQAAIGAFVASYIFSWIGFNTAAFTVFVLLFTIPKIYAMYHPQIDPVLAKVQTQINALVAMVPGASSSKNTKKD